MYYFDKTLVLTFLAAIVLFFTGCDISDPNSSGDRKVSIKMKAISSTASKMMAKMSQSQAVDTLTEVKLLVEELELESSFDEDSLDFEVDDLIVNLPLDGSEFNLTTATVPEGSYDEFEMEIEHDDDVNIDDPDFNNSGDEDDYTVVVKGVYNGENFTYRSKEDFELELELNPPLEVSSSSSASVAINVDPSSWFKDASGNDLDPNDSSNRETIDENIKNSFEAREDDEGDEHDEDDNDDDDENGDEDDDDS